MADIESRNFWTSAFPLQTNWDFLTLRCLSTYFWPPPKGSLPQWGQFIKNLRTGSCCKMDSLFFGAPGLPPGWQIWFSGTMLLVNNSHEFPLDGIPCSAQLTLPIKMVELLPPIEGEGRGPWPWESAQTTCLMSCDIREGVPSVRRCLQGPIGSVLPGSVGIGSTGI